MALSGGGFSTRDNIWGTDAIQNLIVDGVSSISGSLTLLGALFVYSVSIFYAAVTFTVPPTCVIDAVGLTELTNLNTVNNAIGAHDTSHSTSTGVYTGGALSIGSGTTTFTISPGTGVVINNATRVITDVSWTGAPYTNVTVINISTSELSYISISSVGAIIQSTTMPTNAMIRDQIYLGTINHYSTFVDSVHNEQCYISSPSDQLRDLSETLGILNASGNFCTGGTINLTLSKAAGTKYSYGSNYVNDPKNPHLLSLGALDTATVTPIYVYTSNAFYALLSTFPAEIPHLDVEISPGVVVPMVLDQVTVIRVFSMSDNTLAMQYGNTVYTTLTEAKEKYTTDPYTTNPTLLANGMLIAYAFTSKDAANFLNTNETLLLNAGKFQGISGGIGGGNLQSTYNNSSTVPQMVLDSNALTIREGTGGTVLFQLQDTVPTVNFLLDSAGNMALAGAITFTNVLDIVMKNSVGHILLAITESVGIAIGYLAGITNQGSSAIAIGYNAAQSNQGDNAIAIGENAGVTNQLAGSIAVGTSAGANNQNSNSVAIGANAGNQYQGVNSVAIGANAGSISALSAPYGVNFNSVSVGVNAGKTNQGNTSIAIGNCAGCETQGNKAIAIGENAGKTDQLTGGIAIGISAGQGDAAVAGLGQKNDAIAIGKEAGKTTQGASSIAIGNASARTTQGQESIAMGKWSGDTEQGKRAIAIGKMAGQGAPAFGQGEDAIAIGNAAGRLKQATDAVAIGNSAGYDTQKDAAVAIGHTAGNDTQGENSVAIGSASGNLTQGDAAVAIGINAGKTTQGVYTVAVGSSAGETDQLSNSIAIGRNAGKTDQGLDCIAIGYGAGLASQTPGSVILNGDGSTAALNATAKGFFVKPIRLATGTTPVVMAYDTTNNEVIADSSIVGLTNTSNIWTGNNVFSAYMLTPRIAAGVYMFPSSTFDTSNMIPIFKSSPDLENFWAQGTTTGIITGISGIGGAGGTGNFSKPEGNDRDDHYLVMPGYGLIVYQEKNYQVAIDPVSLNFENGGGTEPYYITPNPARQAKSIKIYFTGVQVT